VAFGRQANHFLVPPTESGKASHIASSDSNDKMIRYIPYISLEDDPKPAHQERSKLARPI